MKTPKELFVEVLEAEKLKNWLESPECTLTQAQKLAAGGVVRGFSLGITWALDAHEEDISSAVAELKKQFEKLQEEQKK